MYHTLLGEKLFRKATDLYFDRHDGDAVTCDDFRKAMSDTLWVPGKANLLISLMVNLSNGIYRMVLLHCLLNVSIKWYRCHGFFSQSCPPSQLQPTKLPRNTHQIWCHGSRYRQGFANSSFRRIVRICHGDNFVMTKEMKVCFYIMFLIMPSCRSCAV